MKKRPSSTTILIGIIVIMALWLGIVLSESPDDAATAVTTQSIPIARGSFNKAGDIQGNTSQVAPQNAGSVSPNQLNSLNL